MAARRRTFPGEYGTEPFAQAPAMTSPLPLGLDTGSATQRTSAMPDELDVPDDEDPAAAALRRLLKMSEMFGGTE